MSQVEVTLADWIVFIINNNFDASLFPAIDMPNLTRLILNDLKKGNASNYFKIFENSKALKKIYGSKGFRISHKKLDSLFKAEPNYFSLLIPITGISFEQATKFCKWKEDVINLNQQVKIKVSLPSMAIYAKVITNIDSVCQKKCDSCKQYELNCISANCFGAAKSKIDKSQGVSLVRADSYWPTDDELYCIQGNAAEMTSTEGVAMGGSFRHYARESFNDKIQAYKKAEDWLGFRYVVTLKQ